MASKRPPTHGVLTRDALNRATLARQLLLERSSLGIVAAVEQLAGLQAQVPRPPALGLWSRLATFSRDALHDLVITKQLVRGTLMRGTIHLVSARDFCAWRPALQPMLGAVGESILGDRARGLDLGKLVALARQHLPATFTTLRAALVARFPTFDERALGFTVRVNLPLVLVPTETRWSYPGNAAFAEATTYLGVQLPATAEPDALVLRYLAAFGPATVADAAAWSALRNLAPAFERLRPQLVTFRDEAGRELFDLPAAPRPAADTPAPIRFLPEYDNLVLAHADRTRIVDESLRKRLVSKNGIVSATFLVDGRAAGTWKLAVEKGRAAIVLAPEGKLSRAVRAALETEGDRLLRFVEPAAKSYAVE